MTMNFRHLMVCTLLASPLLAPSAAQAALPDKFPADTILYVGWPGRDALGAGFSDTAMARIMAEPQMAALRARLLPAIDKLIEANLPDEEKQKQAYVHGKALLNALYMHPTALALVSVDANSVIPLVNAGLVVQAGAQSAELAKHIDALLESAGAPVGPIKTVKVGKWEMQELAIMGPAMSVRWGVIDDSLVVTFGNRVLKHLVPGYLAAETQDSSENASDATAPAAPAPVAAAPAAASLAENASFKQAMSVAGAKDSSPVVFVNLKSIISTLDAFQPMLAGFHVPVIGEEGGVKRVLDQIGMDKAESLSIAWTAEAGGLKCTTFLHCPGMRGGGQPLTDADLALVPKNASFASVGNVDLAAMYAGLLNLVKLVSPDTHQQVLGVIGQAEKSMGMTMADVLGSFDDTWVLYDDPDTGSILGSGLTLIAEVKPGNRIDAFLRKGVEVLAEMAGQKAGITVREQIHRGTKIAYLNFAGLPVPVSPAWAEHGGHLVMALFPQMVQSAIDHLMDKTPSLLADEGFQRGRKLLPEKPTSISYVDAPRGVRHLYSIGLPVAQALAGMAQGQQLDLDISLLPPLTAINRHVFDNVSGGVITPDGYLAVSYGAIPAALPAIGQNVTVMPVMVSILLPSLARARELSKRTVSAANLQGIGKGVLVYAIDHDGMTPPDLQTLVKSGAISEKTLTSPNDRDPSDAGSYIYIAGGKKIDDIDPQTIVAYEKTDLHEGEGTNVLYVDGHVEWMMMPQFDEALEQSKKNLKLEEPDTAGERDKSDSTDDAKSAKPLPEEHSTPPADAAEEKEKADLVRRLVAKGGPIATAIETYRAHVGQYPSRLEDLSNEPEKESLAEKWQGPYIKDTAMLEDLWGRPLKYLHPGEINAKSYDLWSVGSDGKSGTEDDIGNFKGSR